MAETGDDRCQVIQTESADQVAELFELILTYYQGLRRIFNQQVTAEAIRPLKVIPDRLCLRILMSITGKLQRQAAAQAALLQMKCRPGGMVLSIQSRERQRITGAAAAQDERNKRVIHSFQGARVV
ncbi:MAG: hypothetical protein EBZ78_09320 [Verrucomicrobia bacterium]|nr:hypothetical protein [Verrucomicrobiota bacterium]